MYFFLQNYSLYFILAPKLPSLLEIETKPAGSTALRTEKSDDVLDASGADTWTRNSTGNSQDSGRLPAWNTGRGVSESNMPSGDSFTGGVYLGNSSSSGNTSIGGADFGTSIQSGNNYTGTTYSDTRIPAGNMYMGSNTRTNMSAGNDYTSFDAEERARNAYTSSEISGTDVAAGNTDTHTAVSAGSTGLALLGSAYGMDMPDEETEQPAGYSSQSSTVPTSSTTRPAPWSKYMNWTQTDTQGQNTVTQSEQGGLDSSQNTGRPAGILRNTSAEMVGRRNAAGFIDYVPKDLPSTGSMVKTNRSQGQTNLAGSSNVQTRSSSRNAGPRTPAGMGLRTPAAVGTRQPGGILKKVSNISLGNNVPAGGNENNPNTPTGNTTPRRRKTRWSAGVTHVTGVKINTPGGVGILYGSSGLGTQTTASDIGSGIDRPTERGELQIPSNDSFQPTSVKGEPRSEKTGLRGFQPGPT